SPKAYLVTSTRPIVAYQHNAYDDVAAFSAGASVLLPQQTLDTSYYGATLPTFRSRTDTNDWSGFVTIVGTSADTRVQVTPTAAVKKGASQPAIAAKETRTFVLQPYDVLNIEGDTNADLTGTRVDANQPVAAFSGHVAAVLPDPFPFI